jgi:hypothetical protein
LFGKKDLKVKATLIHPIYEKPFGPVYTGLYLYSKAIVSHIEKPFHPI